MTEAFDIAVIGAGPAGLAAARTVAEAGCRVAMIDEQAGIGGQIYRGISSCSDKHATVLGADYSAGRQWCDVPGADGVVHLAGATVWQITPALDVCFSQGGVAQIIRPREIIVATGAMERAMPFPGWTLPGVVTAGALQIALKSAGLVPSGPVVLAGSGPLLYLLAVQLLNAGCAPQAIVETTPTGRKRLAFQHVVGFLRSPQYLQEGLGMLWHLRSAGVKHYRHARELTAIGDGRVRALGFICDGKPVEVPCNLLALHQGVVPNTQLTRSLGLEHVWDEAQFCWRPKLDETGQASLPGLSVAGDGAGIAGADAAVISGQLAAFHALKRIGATPADPDLRVHEATRQRHLGARPFLDVLYRPDDAYLYPGGDTVVCRCEEVTAGEVRDLARLGCVGPNQAKAFCRAGMGPCQGRMCGLTVSALIAQTRRTSLDDTGYYRIRPPVKPVTLGELARVKPGH